MGCRLCCFLWIGLYLHDPRYGDLWCLESGDQGMQCFDTLSYINRRAVEVTYNWAKFNARGWELKHTPKDATKNGLQTCIFIGNLVFFF